MSKYFSLKKIFRTDPKFIPSEFLEMDFIDFRVPSISKFDDRKYHFMTDLPTKFVSETSLNNNFDQSRSLFILNK